MLQAFCSSCLHKIIFNHFNLYVNSVLLAWTASFLSHPQPKKFWIHTHLEFWECTVKFNYVWVPALCVKLCFVVQSFNLLFIWWNKAVNLKVITFPLYFMQNQCKTLTPLIWWLPCKKQATTFMLLSRSQLLS